MSAIFQSPLHELKSYEDLVEALKKRKGPLQAAGCMDSQKVHLLAEIGNDTKETLPWQLIITYSEQRVREIEEDYRLFCPQVCSYPAKDFIFYSADIQGKALEQKRLRTLKQMSEQQGGVVVNDEKVANIDVAFTAEQLKAGLKIRKGKKVFHKAIMK